jgi:DNA-binding MarR family transcriptional regulator
MKPEQTIDFHLRWLWMKIMRIYNLEASKFGGTMSVGLTLLNIDKDGTPSTKLGPKMGIESRSLTRALKTMEENGLITKSSDPVDGRMVRVFLTDEGEKYRETARNTVLDLNMYLQNNISEADLETFFKVARKINTLLDHRDIFQTAETVSEDAPRQKNSTRKSN